MNSTQISGYTVYIVPPYHLAICSVVTNTQFIVFKYFGKYLHSDDYLNTFAVLKYCTSI